jgi:ubiquinone/menaquinone biosynthesis C-methylase UbiE
MGHEHHGKSSEKFFTSDEILSNLNLRGDEAFLDAGCGDGHIAIKAIEEYLPNGTAYAVDVHDKSIEILKSYNNENLIAVRADLTKEILGISDASVDVVLMVNVIHGFDESANMNDVITELKRIIRDGGKIAVVEFRPIDWPIGPPAEIKLAPSRLEEIFSSHGFEKTFLTEEMGQEGPDGHSHYMIIFEKR